MTKEGDIIIQKSLLYALNCKIVTPIIECATERKFVIHRDVMVAYHASVHARLFLTTTNTIVIWLRIGPKDMQFYTTEFNCDSNISMLT